MEVLFVFNISEIHRWCMLPSFISNKQAQKVLSTGKSLNFLRHVCNFVSQIGGRDSIKAALQKITGNFYIKLYMLCILEVFLFSLSGS